MKRTLGLALAAALLATACGAEVEASTRVPDDADETTDETQAIAALPKVTTPPTTTTTTTQPPKDPIVLGFGGDVAFTHGLDARDPFGDVLDMLQVPDFTAVNLETTVAEPEVGSPVDKTFVFKSPPHSVGLLTSAGIDAVNLANNHTLDYRREGLLRTIELLNEADVPSFGAGATEADAYGTQLVEVGDWTVGLVGFTHVECGWVADDPTLWPEAAWACPGFEPRTVAAVEAAAASADLVVVMSHWGIQLEYCPQAFQRDLAEAWVQAGADLVIGSHPHVLQGIERIDDAWVVYATGNLAFPSANGPSTRSAFFEFDVSDDGVEMYVTPIEIADGRPRQMSESSSAAMLADLGSWSFGWAFPSGGTPEPRAASGTCG